MDTPAANPLAPNREINVVNPYIAERNGQRFLAVFTPGVRGCTLTTPVRPSEESGFFRKLDFYTCYLSNPAGFRWFGGACLGCVRVQLDGWSFRSADALMRFVVDYSDIVRGFGGADAATQPVIDQFVSVLNLKVVERSLYEGETHVDHFDLTESPLPASAFW